MAFNRQHEPEWCCRICPPGRGSVCGALMRVSIRPADDPPSCVRQSTYSAAAEELVYSADAAADDVFAVCQGWALRFVQLPDGRRQNLAVLLPGDLSLGAMFQERLHSSVEAVTALRITRFASADIKKRIVGDAKILELCGRALAEEQRDIDQRAVDLGRRSAEERVARLVVGLVERIAQRRPCPNHPYAFPLLQRHIADLTGLTPVHVSRVMTDFRNAGLMKLTKGLLTIVELPELKRMAALN